MNQPSPESGPSCPADCIVQEALQEQLISLHDTIRTHKKDREPLDSGEVAAQLRQTDKSLTREEIEVIVQILRDDIDSKIAEAEALIQATQGQAVYLADICTGVVEVPVEHDGVLFEMQTCLTGLARSRGVTQNPQDSLIMARLYLPQTDKDRPL